MDVHGRTGRPWSPPVIWRHPLITLNSGTLCLFYRFFRCLFKVKAIRANEKLWLITSLTFLFFFLAFRFRSAWLYRTLRRLIRRLISTVRWGYFEVVSHHGNSLLRMALARKMYFKTPLNVWKERMFGPRSNHSTVGPLCLFINHTLT